MHRASLRKVGGSVMLALPPAVLDALGLKAGETVGLAVENGRLIVAPTRRPRYRLDELIAQCDASAEMSAEDRGWLDDKPLRRELI